MDGYRITSYNVCYTKLLRLDEIAEISRGSLEKVEEALTVVQDFDPPGVAARNLQECLLNQMAYLDMQDSLVETILREHIAELETRKYPVIAKA